MTYSKKILLASLATVLCIAAVAQNTDRLDFVVRHTTIKPAMRHASFAVCVHNITKDSTVYSRNDDLSMAPSALNKLFTTAAAYSRMGPKFYFENYLYYSGEIDRQGTLQGDLIIAGTGDPFFCSDRFPHTDSTFHRFATALRKKGIKRITGHIYADTSIFEGDMIHPSWRWEDIGNCYGSGACGINYNENSVDVHFRAGRRVGDPAVITSTHPEIPITNQVVTGPRDTLFNICFYGSPYQDSRMARGIIPLGTADTHFRASLPNPAYHMANEFTKYLRANGIAVMGDPAIHFTMPNQYRKLCIDTAFNLFTTTALTTQTNNNLAAESLFKLLGYLRDGHGTFASGRRFMYEYFHELDLNPSEIDMVDGSGISRDNRVTAYFVCQFLDAVARQPFFLDFAGALGISERIPEFDIIPPVPEDCSLRIKSGVASGVRNFAGYFSNADDQLYSFTILCNNYSCDDTTIDQLIKGIIEEIIRL
jgi:D-alanyl-D-alanine carboxypeptidase/D-alanyl-D-alanine-endopeptidase (penicillin-binding protein 4)